MKFSVGYQPDENLKNAVLQYREKITEIFFPWKDFVTGRGIANGHEAQWRLENDLSQYAAQGIGMNLLLNGNCYGRYSQSRKLFQSIGDEIALLIGRYQLRVVTTTSLLFAKFIKTNFPALEIRASVNMEIGTTKAVEYLLDYFDGFYLKREYNYHHERIVEMSGYIHRHGKRLFLLANSGCLNDCSARIYHDNLVAHQHQISEMDNAYNFEGICHRFLEERAARRRYLCYTNIIRPEDVATYDPLCDGIKLATRSNRNPAAVVRAYAEGRFPGNLLTLAEPDHAGLFYPEIIANDRIDTGYAQHRLHCRRRCDRCIYCDKIQAAATIQLKETGGDFL